MDFFDPAFQSGPFTQERFGLCDDQDTTPAYVDVVSPDTWVATVENLARREVLFTAIDKGVIQDDELPGRGRCDGMLTADGLLYLIELKDQKRNWQSDAIEQLQSTIELLRQQHDLAPYRHKKAFGCNRQKNQGFVMIDHELKRRFWSEFGFRLDLQATIKLPE